MQTMGQVLQGMKSRLPTSTGPTPAPIRPASLCIPDCPICGGLGMVRFDVPISDPRFGKTELCPNRDLYTLPGMNERTGLVESELRDGRWTDILDVNNVKDAVAAVKMALEDRAGWVFLWGGPGLAKTLILKIAVAEWVRANRKALACYAPMGDIVDHLRAAFDAEHSNQEAIDRLDYWARLPLLAVDEFEKINPTPWATEKSFRLFDRRYEGACRGETVTLFASNQDPDKLADYMADRIYDGRFWVVELKGDSLRPAMYRNGGRPSKGDR